MANSISDLRQLNLHKKDIETRLTLLKAMSDEDMKVCAHLLDLARKGNQPSLRFENIESTEKYILSEVKKLRGFAKKIEPDVKLFSLVQAELNAIEEGWLKTREKVNHLKVDASPKFVKKI